MKALVIVAAVAALTGCASAPSQTACEKLPFARAMVDAAIARGDRKPTKQDKADLAAVRALEDAECAKAASAPR